MDMNIRNKNVLVTGAGGSIGSELCNQISKLKPKNLVMLDKNEYSLYSIENKIKNKTNINDINIFPILGDVLDKTKIISIIKKFKINTIYHAAAYKHVPLVEKNIIEAFKNNVKGTLWHVLKPLKN